MQQAVDSILAYRARPHVRGRRFVGVTASVLLHGGLTAAVLLLPFLAARNRQPIEFVAVRIVPIHALGVERPRPEPEQPKPEAPTPVPKPTPAEPKPSREAQRTTAPPEPRRAAPPEPQPRRQRQGSPTGSATGTAPFGAAAVGLDNPDFVYSYYVDQMLAMIGANWIRPPVGGGIETLIHFRIGRGGQISELEIVESSGNRAFDMAGLRAVQLANPLPSLPQSYREGSLGVNLVIR